MTYRPPRLPQWLVTDKSRLIQCSFLLLFVELTLIRWTGATVYYVFAYANLVLMASFLGIGLGFLRSKSSRSYFHYAPFLLALFVYFCYVHSYEYRAVLNPATDNLDYGGAYFRGHAYPVWLTLPMIFLAVTLLMAMIAEGVARRFSLFTPLIAYRLEVLGSLLGVIVFSILSFMQASPLAWGVIISLLFVSLSLPAWRLKAVLLALLQLVALACLLLTFAKEAGTPGHFWSSYYKIDLQEYAGHRYVVDVNGLAQQVIESVEQRKRVKPFYFKPYQHAGQALHLDNVLIIGAGTGGDVAIALSQGAKHVDAVEIDPQLYHLGQQYNPDHPYQDPRVNVIINDGRAFLQQTQRHYDLIIFALTDSLFMLPGQSSLRLENYLYTVEAIQQVRARLAPGGVFAIYNYYGERWVVDRLANTLATVFSHPPCLDTFTAKDYWATAITISPEASQLQCPALWQMELQAYATPSTDDHPFLYLMNNRLPTSNAVTLLFILFTAVVLVVRSMRHATAAMHAYLDLFFMGAAFLLLESKSIINYALLFGTTWFVNALVFMGILLTVYLAIELTPVARRWHAACLPVLLFASLLLSWVIPLHVLLTLPPVLRFLLETALVFMPVLAANLLFAARFQETASSVEAFGVNLLGAVLGGILEYCALIVGYRSLLLLIAGLYLVAILLMRRQTKIALYGAS